MIQDTNKFRLAGKVTSEPKLAYSAYDEKFYEINIETERLSKNTDTIKVIISEKIMDDVKLGSFVDIDGQIRTRNEGEDEKKKLLVFCFVKDVKIITEEELAEIKAPNLVEVKGYVCKKPSLRETHHGREISDTLIAINRAYGKSDYVPTISWGRNAKFCSKLEVGTAVKATGRLQSREYTKKENDNIIKNTTYELSILTINKDSE